MTLCDSTADLDDEGKLDMSVNARIVGGGLVGRINRVTALEDDCAAFVVLTCLDGKYGDAYFTSDSLSHRRGRLPPGFVRSVFAFLRDQD